MPNLETRSGITYYYKIENEAAAKRFADTLDRNNKALGRSDKAMQKTAKTAKTSMKQTGDAVEKAANRTEKNTRKFIQSISGIYAAFVLAPKIAQQFGEALKEGAAGKDVREAFENLAESVDVSADQLLSSMKAASKGIITEIELMRQANRAFLAGGAEFAVAIPKLFEIARAAAVATGQDVKFVLDSLTKGIAKASIKLIDNAEVYIKIGEAVEEYAEKLGTTADALDVAVRRQAILQAVLEQGEGLIEGVGEEVIFATDAFLKYETSVDNAKQAMSEFLIDAVGPGAAGQVKALSDVLVGLSGIIQTFALLKIASGDKGLIGGLLGTGAVAAGATKLVGALKGLTPILLAFAAGGFAADKVLQALSDEIFEVTGFHLPSFGKQLELTSMILTDGSQAAREYYREINKIGEFSQKTMDAQAAAREELDKLLRSVMATNEGYTTYVKGVMELNRVLEDGEEAIALMSRAYFDGALVAIAWLKIQEKIRMAEERAAAARERRMERAAEVKPDIERALKAIQSGLEKRKDLYEDYNDDLENEMHRHARRMEELVIDAAFDRADASRSHHDEIVDNERELQRDIEDVQRQHRFRLEDIERQFQRRMLEIRERYERTVVKAGRRRDVLAIINAREQRGIDERDARRDRDESVLVENRNFQERLRQAIEAHQDNLRELKDSLEEELREIDENLRRRQDKEDRAHQERLRKMEKDHAKRMKELEFDLDKEIELIQRKRNYIQGWLDAHPIKFRVGTERTGPPRPIPMQHGFAGMVEGPQTFKVEPGVKEFVYASGNLKGARETPAPSQAASSAMALQHSIRGGISVGMSGLSSQVLSGLGPALQDSIGQAIVDSITTGILGSL